MADIREDRSGRKPALCQIRRQVLYYYRQFCATVARIGVVTNALLICY
nr:MAG TPA: hypothetical protein [Caudoviricetes sp.]